jgi:hypothetical protein
MKLLEKVIAYHATGVVRVIDRIQRWVSQARLEICVINDAEQASLGEV